LDPWSGRADFNGDGFTDGLDFSAWNANKFDPLPPAGPEGGNIVIDANYLSRVMRIDDGNNAVYLNVAINNLTFRNGYVGSALDGAGILSYENLTLTEMTIENNHAFRALGTPGNGGDGGGIAHGSETRPGGTLTITDSLLQFNTASDDAGALDVYNSRDLTVTGTTFESNQSGEVGQPDVAGGLVGFIRVIDAVTPALYGDKTAIFDNCNFYNNTVVGSSTLGVAYALGGLLVSGPTGYDWSLSITDSNFAGNQHLLYYDGVNNYVGGRGGAAYISDVSNVLIDNTTFSGSYGYVLGGALLLSVGYVDSTATISNSTFSSNGGPPAGYSGLTQTGGAIHALTFQYGYTLDLTVDNSTFSGNSGIFGGSLAMTQGVTAVINESTFTGNYASSRGGGLYSRSFAVGAYLDDVTLNRSTVDGNTAVVSGGGIAVSNAYYYEPETLTLINSTISNNVAAGYMGAYGYGGGLRADPAILTVNQSTISGNMAIASGGGIYGHYYNKTYLLRSTVTNNTAGGSGGGVYQVTSPVAMLDVDNTIVSGNTADNIYSAYPYTVTSSFIGGAANLGPLQNNGGPTETHLPNPGSPVINAGTGTRDLGSDQRGFTPGEVGVVDIGSVEVGASAIPKSGGDGPGVNLAGADRNAPTRRDGTLKVPRTAFMERVRMIGREGRLETRSSTPKVSHAAAPAIRATASDLEAVDTRLAVVDSVVAQLDAPRAVAGVTVRGDSGFGAMSRAVEDDASEAKALDEFFAGLGA
jgi:hypothetical protein